MLAASQTDIGASTRTEAKQERISTRSVGRSKQRIAAGEILLTSIDRDGSRGGYDLELTRAVAESVRVPVIASGGAGSADDIAAAFADGHADAALVAGILHDGVTTIAIIKSALAKAGVPVRHAA